MTKLEKILKAAARIGDCRNITPEQLVEADAKTNAVGDVGFHPLVDDISDERDSGDGVWVYLKDGWITDSTDTGSIHEDTWAECIALLKRVRFDRESMEAHTSNPTA